MKSWSFCDSAIPSRHAYMSGISSAGRNGKAMTFLIGVLNGLCKHGSSVFVFASTSGDQICLAISKHFRKYQMASSEHFVNIPLVGISLLLKGNSVLHQVVWLTPPKQENRCKSRGIMLRCYLSSTNPNSLQPIMLCLMPNYITSIASPESVGGCSRRSKAF